MYIQNVEIEVVDYKGRVYDRFYVDKDPARGPGWFVFGMNPEYGDRLRMNCARPVGPRRKYKYYNGRVHRGWRLKREAQEIADRMNQWTPSSQTT